MRRIDVLGKTFGRLKCLKESGKDNHGHITWLCKCDCGNEVVKAGTHLKNGYVVSCGCYKSDTIKKIRRKGTKNISGSYFSSIRSNARHKNREFSLDINYLQNLLEQQNFQCAISGLNLIMELDNSFDITKKQGINTASLDRIDSSKGYTVNNVQWVHVDVNRMKSNFSEDRFIEICNYVSNHNKFRGLK